MVNRKCLKQHQPNSFFLRHARTQTELLVKAGALSCEDGGGLLLGDGTYHVGKEGGGMFVEADDPLAQMVSPEAVGEGSQFLLHLHTRVHTG